MQRRLVLEDLAAQAAAIIRQEPDPEERALLVERHNDAVISALDGDRWGDHWRILYGLRERFEKASRRYWLPNDDHSVKVDEPRLRLVR